MAVPKTFDDAKTMQQQAIRSLNEVRAGKAAAEATPPGTDLSKRNLERAKREGWQDGSLPGQHTPNQYDVSRG